MLVSPRLNPLVLLRGPRKSVYGYNDRIPNPTDGIYGAGGHFLSEFNKNTHFGTCFWSSSVAQGCYNDEFTPGGELDSRVV